MIKLIRELREHGVLLLCSAVIAATALISWEALSVSPYLPAQSEYAVCETEPTYNDVIRFDYDKFEWHPYEFPLQPHLPAGAKTVYLTCVVPADTPLF